MPDRLSPRAQQQIKIAQQRMARESRARKSWESEAPPVRRTSSGRGRRALKKFWFGK